MSQSSTTGWPRAILHMDMDAFFASVEQLDNPALRGKCVIVGGIFGRGVVAAASYEARRFGVRSAMPIFQARRLCPHGIFIPPRRDRYREISRQVMAILHTHAPLVEPLSIDEAFADITGLNRLHGAPERLARSLKDQICQETDLTCSVGLAPNKFLAKVASDHRKPDGLTIIRPEEAARFAAALPINKVPGIGRTREKQLSLLGIVTLGDLQACDPALIHRKLGRLGPRLLKLSRGIDDTPVTPPGQAKSISSEETLLEDTLAREVLENHIRRQADEVARELRKEGLKARTLTLKLKHADFKQVTRSLTLKEPTHCGAMIGKAVIRILDAYPLENRIRLIGVGASGLVGAGTPSQIPLFEESARPDGWEKVEQALDHITAKYGKNAVRKGGIPPS